MFDVIYNMNETSMIKHIGFISDEVRYDFSIIYTSQFFGKSLISCLQSGNTVLFDNSDLFDLDFIKKAFKLTNLQEASTISSFLQSHIPNLPISEQYS